MENWARYKRKYPRLPLLVSLSGLIFGGYIDKTRDWALAKAMLTPYLIPALLVVIGLLWFIHVIYQPPRLEILYDGSRHPFCQPFMIENRHYTLLRVGIRNGSKFRAVNRAEVKLTAAHPFMMDSIPARLRLMNETETAREFFLAPDGIQYVDLLQYGPNKSLWLWHTVPNQSGNIEWTDYHITITVYGDNTGACSKEFSVIKQTDSIAIIPKVDSA